MPLGADLNVERPANAGEWLLSKTVGDITQKHNESMKKREVSMDFNVFSLVSSSYHRENLHSDMIAAILSPLGGHGFGTRLLHAFLDYLRDQHLIRIDSNDYAQAFVYREAGRIDLAICDAVSRRAIIIENKINGAPDMDRQVVRYLETLTKTWKYDCDAIIYLCLDQPKRPDTVGWTKEEEDKVEPLLRIVSAFSGDDSKKDLCNGWLQPAIELTKDQPETSHVISQYRQLILHLGRHAQNKSIMTDFYKLVLDQQSFDFAQSVRSMTEALPKYRSQRALEVFQSDYAPFQKRYYYDGFNSYIMAFEGLSEGRLKLHVNCTDPGRTVLEFWHNSGEDPRGELPRRILQEGGMLERFAYDSQKGWFTKSFDFPAEEEALYQFIRDFKTTLKLRYA